MHAPACPLCRSPLTKRSRRRGLYEDVMLRLSWRAPFRCNLCRHRFFGHWETQPDTAASAYRATRRPGRRVAATDTVRPVLIIGALACLLTLGLLVLWALAGAFDLGGVFSDMFAWLLPAVTKPLPG